MNRRITLTIVVASIIGIGIGRYLIPSHSDNASQQTNIAADDHSGHDVVSEPETWTCSMHPQIQQGEPGDCPICGMDLIPLIKDVGADDGPRVMSMSESSRALADIQTTIVQRVYPEAEVRLVGLIDYDETREKSLTARFPARIDELFVNFTGVTVTEGQHLAEVYSPELLSAQRELLTAYRSDPNSSITRAAREKLRLWDLLPDQIDAIIKSGKAKDSFVLRAPIGGVVVNKHVKEGDYIKTGEPLFRIVDLSELWLYLDAYESDITWLRYGQDVSFTVESYPGESFNGQIAFIEPEINRKTRTVPVRVNVPNTDGRLKPGMFARGIVSAKMAEGGRVYAPAFAGKWISPMHPEIVKDGPGTCDVCGMDLVPAEDLGYVENAEESAPLVIPASSVLRTGKRAVVYVEKPDAERPTYEGRNIVLGPRAGNYFLVGAGLDEGERVVTKGAFKIDSALQIQAKPSMMNPDGGGSMPGHNHGAESGSPSVKDHSQGNSMNMLEISADIAPQLLEPYLELQSALAGDDLDAAKEYAKSIMQATGHSGALPDLLHDMLAADTLDAMRKPHFEILSNAIIDAAKANPELFGGDLLRMYCPMVYGDRGADWLQRSEPLRNPYFGAMMLKCGEIKETIKATIDGHEGHDH